MTSYETEYALVYLAEQIIKTFGKDFGIQVSKQEPKRKPAEPLIEDEKIRKAVKAWSEANRTKYVWVSTALKGIDITQDYEHLQLTEYKQSITFECEADFKSGNYTIDELCGEEEE